MNWKSRTVLVTGAGGFIGSHLTERLVALGAKTRAFVRYNSTDSWGWLDDSPVKDEVEVVAGDVQDHDSVHKAVRGADIVFHLAALIGIPYSYCAPVSYVRTNIEGTLNILVAARAEETELVVQTSTSEVYGTAQYAPIDETHPLQGQSPYSASKIGADKMAEASYLSFEQPVAIVRPFNTYGPRQSARAVIPTIITQALSGTEIRVGSLWPTRDFTFVKDTVEGFIKVGASPAAVGQVTNIGTSQEISIDNLIKTILALTGRDLPVISEDQRVRPDDSEVGRLLANNEKAKELLGWYPEYDLKEGLGQTIDWIRENIERYRIGTYTV